MFAMQVRWEQNGLINAIKHHRDTGAMTLTPISKTHLQPIEKLFYIAAYQVRFAHPDLNRQVAELQKCGISIKSGSECQY